MRFGSGFSEFFNLFRLTEYMSTRHSKALTKGF